MPNRVKRALAAFFLVMRASIYVGATYTQQIIDVWVDSLRLGDSEPTIGSLIRAFRTFLLDECEVICRPRTALRKHMCGLPEDSEMQWRTCTTAYDLFDPPPELAGFGMNRVASHTFGTQVFRAYSIAISTTKVGEKILLRVVPYDLSIATGQGKHTFPGCLHVKEAVRRAVDSFVPRLSRLGTPWCKPSGCWRVVPAEHYRECSRIVVWFRSVARQRGHPAHVVNACVDLLLHKRHSSIDQCWNGNTLGMVIEENSV